MAEEKTNFPETKPAISDTPPKKSGKKGMKIFLGFLVFVILGAVIILVIVPKVKKMPEEEPPILEKVTERQLEIEMAEMAEKAKRARMAKEREVVSKEEKEEKIVEEIIPEKLPEEKKIEVAREKGIKGLLPLFSPAVEKTKIEAEGLSSLTLEAKASLEEVREFYEKALLERGWKKIGEIEKERTFWWNYQKGKKQCFLTLTPEKGKTIIILQLLEE